MRNWTKNVPLANQPDDAPPKKLIPSKWQNGPGLPTITQLTVGQRDVVLVFEDGSRARLRNVSKDDSKLALIRSADCRLDIPTLTEAG